MLDALGKVEGISSTRNGGIGYSHEALFSQPAQVPSTINETSEAKPWVAPSTRKRQAANAASRRTTQHNASLTGDTVFHRARGILNKLTPERFDKLSLELLNVGINSEVTLRGLIILVFDKAVDEPKFSSLYAQLCERLGKDAPSFEPAGRQPNTFHRLLITKCQDEFESRAKITSESTNLNFQTDEEKNEFAKTKRKMLGNIRFIGELGKLDLLNEGNLHKCIQQLLEKKRGLSITDQAEDLECLCQIMKTVGKRLDTEKASLWMNQYFARMASIRESSDMPSRIRFMLQDVCDMRANKWEPRHAAKEMLPQTIGQIREGFAHTKNGSSIFERQATPKNANADLYDIFGNPMTRQGAGGTKGKESFRPNSPSNRQYYNRPADQGMGWKDPLETEKRDWQVFGGERDMKSRDVNQRDRDNKDNRGKPDNNDRGRDFQPRYATKGLPSMSGGDKLSLRPGANIYQRTSFKPSSPHQLPKSARSTNTSQEAAARPTPIFTQPQTPVIIKQEPRQKPKKQQVEVRPANPPNKANETSKAGQLVEACSKLWTAEDVDAQCDDICALFKQLDIKTLQTKVSRQIMKQALNQKDISCIVNMSQLLQSLLNDGHINKETVEKILAEFLDELPLLESDHPDVKQQAAGLLSSSIVSETISLASVCDMLNNGVNHPLALQLLQKLCKSKGEDWVCDSMKASGLTCLLLLPASLVGVDTALSTLEEYGLGSLEPMLKIQRMLWVQICEDSNPTSLFKWIMTNIESKHRDSDDFTRILFKSLLKFVVSKTTLCTGQNGSGLPDKTIQEEEKTTFTTYQDIMLRFLHESHHRQMIALYSLQVFCHENSFPKGMMLRVFTYLYDLEIVDEDVFLEWKESINEEYPGKGKALFQVNQWLTWLEQAESESDDDDGED